MVLLITALALAWACSSERESTVTRSAVPTSDTTVTAVPSPTLSPTPEPSPTLRAISELTCAGLVPEVIKLVEQEAENPSGRLIRIRNAEEAYRTDYALECQGRINTYSNPKVDPSVPTITFRVADLPNGKRVLTYTLLYPEIQLRPCPPEGTPCPTPAPTASPAPVE